MTAAILTRLPLEAGGAVLATTGRAVHSLFAWGFAHYMRAPLASTGIAAMLTLGLVASSNALYFQHTRHPSPLFAIDERPVGAIDPDVSPVVPAPRPVKKTALTSTTPKLVVPKVETPRAASEPVKPIGNADVFSIQRKLESMKLFRGTVDGYYGPQTANAIRAFEKAEGLKQTGELNAAIIKAILAAPIPSAEPKIIPTPEPVPAADPLPKVVTPQVTVQLSAPEPVAEAVPLPMPEKLPEPQVTVTAVVEPVAQRPTPRRELPRTPQEAMNIAADTAGDAIETIINGVQSLAMTSPPERKPQAAILAPAPLQFGAVEPTPRAERQVATDPQVTASVAPVAATTAVANASVEIKPQEVPVLDTDATVEELQPASQVNDPVFVARVQRGLASLGFLHGPIDGQPSEATARAIRTFETFYNYERTGRITAELPDLLVKAGATL